MANNDKPGCVVTLAAFATILLVVGLVMVAMVTVLAIPFMWLWSLSVAPIFALPLLSFSEAFGLVGIIGIIAFLFRTGNTNRKE